MSRERIRQRAEVGMKKYFPAAHVEIDAPSNSLITYTCATNLSQVALETVAPAVEQNADYAQLRRFRSVSGLRTFALVFDRQTILFDLATNNHTIVPNSPQHLRAVQSLCSSSVSAAR